MLEKKLRAPYAREPPTHYFPLPLWFIMVLSVFTAVEADEL